MARKRGDDFLARIEAFNEAKGGGVVIRKAARGYSLFRADTGRPVARLRPTGRGDQVEVLWWSHRDRWDQMGIGLHLRRLRPRRAGRPLRRELSAFRSAVGA